jgi:hypothetical protein
MSEHIGETDLLRRSQIMNLKVFGLKFFLGVSKSELRSGAMFGAAPVTAPASASQRFRFRLQLLFRIQLQHEILMFYDKKSKFIEIFLHLNLTLNL